MRVLRLVREGGREGGSVAFFFAFFFVEGGLLFFSLVPTASECLRFIEGDDVLHAA